MKKSKVVICGGGSTYTLPMLKTLCEFEKEFPVSEIRLYDIEPSKQDMIYQAGRVLVQESESDILLSSHYDEQAFKDVDFAFLQIRAGGLPQRELDEKIPLKYGCVGQETCGAGGFAYGLRSVKEVVELIRKIRSQSKDAWIINYSNPAAIVAVATSRVFPDDSRIVNLCDMPIAMMDGFAEAFKMKRQDLSPRYFGLNHFGWFTHLYDRNGNDLLPVIKNQLAKGALMPGELSNDSGWVETFQQLQQMSIDVEGHLPNTYLQYYLYPEAMVSHSDKNYTRANFVMDHRLKEVQSMCEMIVKNKSIVGSGLERGVHGTYIVELANSLLTNQERTFIAIVKNQGIIPNLPENAMVEVPCLVNQYGIQPMHVGPIGTFYKGLLENQFAYESLAVDAVMNEDYDAALKALILNRTVNDVNKAKLILDDLIEANKHFWTLRKVGTQ